MSVFLIKDEDQFLHEHKSWLFKNCSYTFKKQKHGAVTFTKEKASKVLKFLRCNGHPGAVRKVVPKYGKGTVKSK